MKATKMSFMMIGEINCVTSRQWNIILHFKKMSLPAMRRHVRNLNACH